MENENIESMSTDELWDLRDQIQPILAWKLKDRMDETKKRIRHLNSVSRTIER